LRLALSFALVEYCEKFDRMVQRSPSSVPPPTFFSPHAGKSNLVYTHAQVLCHQRIFVYTEPQALCYERINGFRSEEVNAREISGRLAVLCSSPIALYIHTCKSFIINQYLYIQNRNPFIMNESMHLRRAPQKSGQAKVIPPPQPIFLPNLPYAWKHL
jgi:hypothetical protein